MIESVDLGPLKSGISKHLDTFFNKTVYVTIVLVKMNKIEGTTSSGKILIYCYDHTQVWVMISRHEYKLRKWHQKAFKTKNELHIKNNVASFCRKYVLKSLNYFDLWESMFKLSG
jgi:hypothetical protein